MNILLDISAAITPLSGVGRYALELAQRLPGQPGIGEVRYLRGATVGDTLESDVPAPAPTPAWREQARRLLPYKLLLSPYRRRKAMRLARQLEPFRDYIFHSTNFSMPPVSSASVVTVHDMSVFLMPEFHPRDRVNYLREQISHSVACADHLVTVSEPVRAEMLEHFKVDPARITAIPLGVGDAYHPRPAESLAGPLERWGLEPGGYLLSVGTIEPRKNLHGLLRAYSGLDAGLKARYPLVIAGPYGWKGSRTLDEIKRLEAKGDVIYLQYVPEAELPLLYAGAAAFCYFSFYEGFGLPVLEAFASDVPVACSDIAALRDLSDGCAMLADPHNPAAMRDAIEKVLTDRDWRAAATSRGRERRHRYNWEETVSRHVALFSGIGT